jgi:hypothetical protein
LQEDDVLKRGQTGQQKNLLMSQHTLKGDDMFAGPRVATFVSHTFARVALIRMCQVHFVGVVRIVSRRNQKYIGITMLTQIINAATRAYRLHDKLADFGHFLL